MESNELTVENLVDIYKRESNELEMKFFRTQTRFDDYVAMFCRVGGFSEKDLTEEQIRELAFDFLEY